MNDAIALPVAAHPAVRELLRRILALAAPTTLVVLLQAGGQLAETWLAARQGTAALSAWAVVLPFALMMQQMSAGAMGGGVVSAIARTLGAGNREEASALVVHALVIAGTAALIFSFLLAGIPSIVLGAIAGREIAAAATPYAFWLFGIGAIPVWASNTLASVMRGGGRHALAARVLVISGIAYPPLAWVLMERLGQGLPGAGMAFAFTNAAAALALGVLVMRGGAGFRPHLRTRLHGALFKRILSVGLIASMLAVIANLTTILVTAQMAAYGVVAVAAYGISARLEFLMIPLSFGVGSALTALVGRAVGARDRPTARRTARTGGLLTFAIAGSVGLLVGWFPAGFAGAFAHALERRHVARVAGEAENPGRPVSAAPPPPDFRLRLQSGLRSDQPHRADGTPALPARPINPARIRTGSSRFRGYRISPGAGADRCPARRHIAWCRSRRSPASLSAACRH